MEITDFDSSTEEQELRILHLRKALAAAHDRISELESELSDVSERREAVEKDRADLTFRFGEVLKSLDEIHAAQERMAAALQALTQAVRRQEE
jgi:predicted  nucleic acid-binding Zn-ribbon protein